MANIKQTNTQRRMKNNDPVRAYLAKIGGCAVGGEAKTEAKAEGALSNHAKSGRLKKEQHQ